MVAYYGCMVAYCGWRCVVLRSALRLLKDALSGPSLSLSVQPPYRAAKQPPCLNFNLLTALQNNLFVLNFNFITVAEKQPLWPPINLLTHNNLFNTQL